MRRWVITYILKCESWLEKKNTCSSSYKKGKEQIQGKDGDRKTFVSFVTRMGT